MKWLNVKDIDPPKDLSYAESLRFLRDELTQSKEYNRKIINLAIISFLLWLVFMMILAIIKKDWSIFFDIKMYPSVLWATLTGAFSEFELIEKKKQFQELVAKSNIQADNIDDDKLKTATWEELKSISK